MSIEHLVPGRRPDPARFDDPGFVRAADRLAGFVRAADRLAARTATPGLVVVGAPTEAGSISGGAFADAPGSVRAALERMSVGGPTPAPIFAPGGLSLGALQLLDAGDAVLAGLDVTAIQERLESIVAAVTAQWAVPLVVLGGDDCVTVAVARGVQADALVTLDAHHDCRDPGLRVTNGSPVRQLIEGGLDRVVQVGIAPFANGAEHARWALDHGVTVFDVFDVHARGITAVLEAALQPLADAARIAVDLDLDVLDRAHAPGAPASLPGGLLPHQVIQAMFVLGAHPHVVALAITELDPARDVAEMTARMAAIAFLSFAAGVASRPGAP